jgi:hypothetical protein
MKLLFCPYCRDIIALKYELRKCQCGKSSGKYLEDGDCVVVSKDALTLGIENKDLLYCLITRPKDKTDIDCWVHGEAYHKIKRTDS